MTGCGESRNTLNDEILYARYKYTIYEGTKKSKVPLCKELIDYVKHTLMFFKSNVVNTSIDESNIKYCEYITHFIKETQTLQEQLSQMTSEKNQVDLDCKLLTKENQDLKADIIKLNQELINTPVVHNANDDVKLLKDKLDATVLENRDLKTELTYFISQEPFIFN